MRSVRMLVALAVGLVPLTVVLSGLAAPPPVSAVPMPSNPANRQAVNLPARILSMKRPLGERGSPLSYTSGPLDWDVTVAAATNAPLATNLVIAPPWMVAHPFKVPVSAAMGAEVIVHVHDTTGLIAGCGESTDDVWLESAPTVVHRLYIQPSCTFTTEVVDTEGSIPPDTRHNQEIGKLYSAGSSLAAPFACKTGLTVTSTIRNNAPSPATDVISVLKGPQVSAGSPGFNLAPGGSQAAVITTPTFGLAGNYSLSLVAGGVPIHQPAWSVRLTPTCSVNGTLKPRP